jgi:hypothetical protein
MAYPVSDDFRPALIVDHVDTAVATVIDLDGATLATLQIMGGNVTFDIDRSVRAEAGDLTLIDPDGTLTPNDIADILSPLAGHEIKLERGIVYADGTSELVPLGVFGFNQVTVDLDNSGLTLTVGGLQDRAGRVGESRYTKPYSIATSTALETVIKGLVQRGWPAAPGVDNLPTTGITITGRSWGSEGDADPWNDAVDLADAQGYRLYFDGNGSLTMEQYQDLGDLEATVTYDSTNPIVLSIARTWDTFNTYNGVIAVGEGSGLLIPFQAVAWDDDPASPTYYLGAFGKRPRIYSSPNILSKADAVRTANAQLKKTLGVTETVSWTQIPDPSLQVGDGVQVTIDAAAVDNLYRIDRIDLPLSPMDLMQVTARAKRITA